MNFLFVSARYSRDVIVVRKVAGAKHVLWVVTIARIGTEINSPLETGPGRLTARHALCRCTHAQSVTTHQSRTRVLFQTERCVFVFQGEGFTTAGGSRDENTLHAPLDFTVCSRRMCRRRFGSKQGSQSQAELFVLYTHYFGRKDARSLYSLGSDSWNVY